jgi:nicotinamide-nucleotide amidase
MLGSVLNTHQQWLCRELASLGYVVTRQVAVADSGEMIEQAVREALARSDLVITTGGLGPTSDDITRDRIARLLGCPLREDPSIVRHIEDLFGQRHRKMPVTTRVQALVPEGATVLPNAHGTAPGLVLEIAAGRWRVGASLLIMLPGPPRELRPMFTNQVVPLLQARFPQLGDFVCRTFKTTGLGESLVEERIAVSLRGLTTQGLELGYCARVGEVELRCGARGPSARHLVTQAEEIIRTLLPDHLFSVGEDTLEATVVRLLTEQQRSLAVAESCTGGLIAHRLTNVPGASAVFLGGLVTYSNEAKKQFLGVQDGTLRSHGAVSAETVREMAEGARSQMKADYSIAVTGIAGPSGGTPEKPVGTVFIGLASQRPTRVIQSTNRYDRETFKFVTSQQALDMLWRVLLKERT